MKPQRSSLERALEEAVSRALRDNLAPLQRTADELHQAYSDLVAACASTRPSNALPAMLRAQTAASALAAGLSVLSNFVAVALNPRESENGANGASATVAEAFEPEAADVEVEPPAHATVAVRAPAHQEGEPAVAVAHAHGAAIEPEPIPIVQVAPLREPEEHIVEGAPVEPAPTQVPVFDIAALPPELQDLHRRANRVAKVAMQDIKLLRPKDVESGREQKDICNRLRADLDKARKEYDRRFRAISDHPVDYFHHWALEILAGGDRAALGEYPYPSALVHH